ncbi:MAG: hypothetical protein ACLFOC_05265 [Campylobacterales bacterium]
MQTLKIEVSDEYASRLDTLIELFPSTELKIERERSVYKEEFLKRYPTKQSYMDEIKRDVELYKEGKLETQSLEEAHNKVWKKIEKHKKREY